MYKSLVFMCVLAVAAAKPSLESPVAYSNIPVAYSVVSPVSYSSVLSPGVSSVTQHSSSVVHGSPAIPAVYSPGYAPVLPAYSALAQAPGSPAVVLDAEQGVPLDTPEVVAARVAHYQVKALF